MKFINLNCYRTTFNGASQIDRETSFEKDITEQQAKDYMELLENMGYTRHENNSTIFYSVDIDSTHSSEYIFEK